MCISKRWYTRQLLVHVASQWGYKIAKQIARENYLVYRLVWEDFTRAERERESADRDQDGGQSKSTIDIY